jgi:hypothetical protein
MALQKERVGGAAAEGFDSDGAGSRVGVEERRACDARGEDVEQGLAQAVGGGTRGCAGDALQAARTELSGDDPHQPTVTRA